MNTSRRGNSFEVELAKALEDQGALVGSRRRIAGVGDLLVYGPELGRVRLVEAKTTAGGPYERFGRIERAIMISVCRDAGAEAWLAWRPPRASVVKWISSDEWPRQSGRAV